MLICPHDGHAVDPEDAAGPNCSWHEVPWFMHCSACGAHWPVLERGPSVSNHTDYSGDDFCAECAIPARWLSRPRLLAWVRDQLQASGARGDLPRPATLELIEALKRLDETGADDDKTVAARKRLRDVPP
jgi:hypothetical protein